METELGAYRSYLGQSTTQLELLNYRQQIELMVRENSPESKKKPEDRDFTGVIARDLPAIAQAQADVRLNLDGVSRLIETLPVFSNDLREQHEKLKSEIEASYKQLESTLKPSAEHNWRRAVQVKLALLQPLLNGVRVLVLGDAVQTRAEAQIKLLRYLEAVIRWSWRIFFVLGLTLGFIGALTKQETFGGGE